jgi:hypothetical protein
VQALDGKCDAGPYEGEDNGEGHDYAGGLRTAADESVTGIGKQGCKDQHQQPGAKIRQSGEAALETE